MANKRRIDEESIIQTEQCCWLCGNDNPNVLERHEAFGGANRPLSIADKLTVLLCGETCHRLGKYAIHGSRGVGNREQLQREAMQAAVDYYGWTPQQFYERYKKMYL